MAGNMFALWLLVVRERRNWHTGVVLSCNLAISDLLYVLTLPLLIVYYSLGKHWVFGGALCKIERFLFSCNLYVSIFFIMAISVNRCVAIACPFFTRSYVEPAHAKVVSVIIWIVVGVISCPELKFATVNCNEHNNNNTLDLEKCQYNHLEKRKIGLLVGSVIVLYAISFVPYHIFQIYHLYQKINKHKECWVYDMYQVSKGLATLNMCIHPILYMALFDSIRVACCGKSSEEKQLGVMRK
ncbi:hypothetical protein F7725_003273 [Dissostichus mawsoni]|uniref:G-protein coupled receptors family 1 profile domain-containing protein n=1 Tax=Dissostichus mawsoni TaxID=36200 RepID=A0A7J5Y9V8_DISMA|nr:hypothetical protein F7725_003273 [Dissostichus mawsoni]